MGVCSGVGNVCSKDVVINNDPFKGHLDIYNDKNSNKANDLKKLINYDYGTSLLLYVRLLGVSSPIKIIVSLGDEEHVFVGGGVGEGNNEYKVELRWWFSKVQVVKIEAFEGGKEIKSCSFFFGKMLNISSPPRLLLDAEGRQELVVKVARRQGNVINQAIERFNGYIDKRCEIRFNILKFKAEPGYYFFTVSNSKSEILYTSETFGYNMQQNSPVFISTLAPNSNNKNINNKNINNINNISNISPFCFSSRTNYISPKFSIYLHRVPDEEIIGESEFNIEDVRSNQEMEVKLKTGSFYDIFSSNFSIKLKYKEKEYTPFIEYIYYKLHLGLFCIFDDVKSEDINNIKSIVSYFYDIISLYDEDNNNFRFCLLTDTDNIFKIKTDNCIDNALNELPNNKRMEKKKIELFPILTHFINNNINKNEIGVNKLYIILVFTNNSFSDLERFGDKYEYLKGLNIIVKLFNFGDDYINVNFNECDRKVLNIYNVKGINFTTKENIEIISDIPMLIEDYFEYMKNTKWTIFD